MINIKKTLHPRVRNGIRNSLFLKLEQFYKYPKEVEPNMPNSGNFHMSKSNAPKIFCAWCQKWKTGHIVLKFTKVQIGKFTSIPKVTKLAKVQIKLS